MNTKNEKIEELKKNAGILTEAVRVASWQL